MCDWTKFWPLYRVPCTLTSISI
uniref:Uncharacterized protein n=1 Tax=Arundo donax TaxID=35708 RepID=A0A0A9F100_ARUDO